MTYSAKASNNALNADAFLVRYAHYKLTGYGWRGTSIHNV